MKIGKHFLSLNASFRIDPGFGTSTMTTNSPTTSNRYALHSLGMFLVALTSYCLVLILPPPVSISRLFVEFHFGAALVLCFLSSLILKKRGLAWETLALTLTLLLFAMGLIHKWQIAMYDGSIIGGLLPWSDAKDYFLTPSFC